MIEKIRKNINSGVANVRWLARFLAERSKVETSIYKLRYESSRIEKRIDELHKDIGKRVLELKEKEVKEVFKDFIVQQTMDEIKTLKREVEGYRGKEEEANKVPE